MQSPAGLEAMQLGAVDYLEKSLPPEVILRIVETHLRPRAAAA
jgi:FixJ family two-component response regulator